MPPRQMNNAQIHALLYRIAWTYLEVERGLRPPEHLQRFVAPYEYRRQRAAPRPDRPRLGPVQPQDLGPIHFERHGDDCITANLVARRGDERWGAVVLEMRGSDSGWHVSHLERLERAVQTPEPRDDAEVPDPAELLDRRIRLVETEHSLVGAAMTATARRIEDIGDRRTRASKQLSQQLDRWADRLSDLDEELDTLTRRRELLNRPPTREQEQNRSMTMACDIEGLLGPRPDEPHRAWTWDRTAADIQSYRARWSIPDDGPPLGAPTDNETQNAEREKMIKRICEFRREHPTDIERSPSTQRSTPPHPDLGPEL